MKKIKALMGKLKLSTILGFIRSNPVLLLDVAKYATALLLLIGFPAFPGLVDIVTVVVLLILTLITRRLVVPASQAKTMVEDAAKAAEAVVAELAPAADPEKTQAIQVKP